MAKREISPFLKSALELGPVLAFFVAYLLLKDRVFDIGGRDYEGFIVVTAGFVPLMVAATGVLWWLTGTLSRMQVVTVVLIVVFGGLSVWLNDERFFKMKPTLIYLIFGGVLGFGLLRGQSYLRYVMEGLVPLREEGWMILTKRVTVFFLALALANEIVWRTMSTDMWVNFKVFGIMPITILFSLSQLPLLQRYKLETDAASDGET